MGCEQSRAKGNKACVVLIEIEEEITIIKAVDEVPQDRGLMAQVPVEVETGVNEVA